MIGVFLTLKLKKKGYFSIGPGAENIPIIPLIPIGSWGLPRQVTARPLGGEDASRGNSEQR
jgi:hypothetical protein